MYDYRKLTPVEQQQIIQERLANGHPPHTPPHLELDDRLFLLTAACYEHKHHINSPARQKHLLDKLFEAFINHGMEIIAWVILTNHYHLLVHASEAALLQKIFGRIHGSTSFEWNGEENKRGRKVWYRYSDRAIRSERHYYTTLNYIHFNPVKHKLAATPYDWPHSSVNWYRSHYGRDWLRDLWREYPVRDYGKKWDNF